MQRTAITLVGRWGGNFDKAPIGRGFGKQVGTLLAGHNIFIAGAPQKYTPALARHFILVESLMHPASFALWLTHYASTYANAPDRAALAVDMMQEFHARHKALMFWFTQLTTNRYDAANAVTRVVALSLELLTLPFWILFASAAPGGVHASLAMASDILNKKYQTTDTNAPPFYHEHIQMLERFNVRHSHLAEKTVTNVPTAVIIWCLMVLFMVPRGSGDTRAAMRSQYNPV
jgi:hypothetical protein